MPYSLETGGFTMPTVAPRLDYSALAGIQPLRPGANPLMFPGTPAPQVVDYSGLTSGIERGLSAIKRDREKREAESKEQSRYAEQSQLEAERYKERTQKEGERYQEQLRLAQQSRRDQFERFAATLPADVLDKAKEEGMFKGFLEQTAPIPQKPMVPVAPTAIPGGGKPFTMAEPPLMDVSDKGGVVDLSLIEPPKALPVGAVKAGQLAQQRLAQMESAGQLPVAEPAPLAGTQPVGAIPSGESKFGITKDSSFEPIHKTAKEAQEYINEWKKSGDPSIRPTHFKVDPFGRYVIDYKDVSITPKEERQLFSSVQTKLQRDPSIKNYQQNTLVALPGFFAAYEESKKHPKAAGVYDNAMLDNFVRAEVGGKPNITNIKMAKNAVSFGDKIDLWFQGKLTGGFLTQAQHDEMAKVLAEGANTRAKFANTVLDQARTNLIQEGLSKKADLLTMYPENLMLKKDVDASIAGLIQKAKATQDATEKQNLINQAKDLKKMSDQAKGELIGFDEWLSKNKGHFESVREAAKQRDSESSTAVIGGE